MEETEKFRKINIERAAEETPQEYISGAVDRLEAMLDGHEVLDEARVKELHDKIYYKASFLDREDFLESLPILMKCVKLRYKLSREQNSAAGIKLENTIANKQIEGWIQSISDRGRSDIRFGILEELPKKENFIESLTLEQVMLLLEAYVDVYISGDFWQKLDLREFFKKNGSALFSAIRKSGGDEKNITQIQEYFDGDSLTFYALQEAFRQEGEFMNENHRARATQFLIENIEKYGIPGKNVAQSWLTRTDPDEFLPIAANFSQMESLEKKQAGIVKFLYFERGIRNFERYPLDLLIDQFKENDDKEKPYGIILNPFNDWNGAFSGNEKIWERLAKQLRGLGYVLRVVEAGGKFEAGKRLVRLDRTYGKEHKISFAFIGGHGSKDFVQFGGLEEIHSLHAKDLTGRGIGKSSRFFEQNPTIILVSCSTGAKAGIGEKLSEVMSAEVIAPDVPTYLKDVMVSKKEGGLHFDVEYKENRSGRVFHWSKKQIL